MEAKLLREKTLQTLFTALESSAILSVNDSQSSAADLQTELLLCDLYPDYVLICVCVCCCMGPRTLVIVRRGLRARVIICVATHA